MKTIDVPAPLRSLVLGLVMTVCSLVTATFPIFTSVAWADTIADLPPSKNQLVNDLTTVIVNHGGLTTETPNSVIANLVFDHRNAVDVFKSLTALFDEISLDTERGAEFKLSQGKQGDFEWTVSSSDYGRRISYTRDLRLVQFQNPGPPIASYFGAIFLQLDRLSSAEYAQFENAFIKSLKASRAMLPHLNAVLKLTAIREGREKPAPMNRTFADTLLLHAFEDPFYLLGDASEPSARERTVLRRQRIVSLMQRTLIETDALHDLKPRIFASAARTLEPSIGRTVMTLRSATVAAVEQDASTRADLATLKRRLAQELSCEGMFQH